MLRRLLVLYESEEACRARMLARGFSPEVAGEIAFYLAQATDFVAVQGSVAEALAAVGVELSAASLDDREEWLPLVLGPERGATLLWCLTDGFAFYRGSFLSSLAALLEVPHFGSPPAAQHLCQDKLLCTALVAALGLATPATALTLNGEPLSPLPPTGPWLVKPATLGAKIGIGADSLVETLPDALALSRRIWRRFRDRALVQAYIPGRDVRVSFLDLGDERAPLGIHAVRASARGFATLEDSRRITQMRVGDGQSLAVESLGRVPAIEDAARRVAKVLDLRDYWSMDFRLAADGTPWFLELEVCPAITIYDFLTYLREAYALGLPEAIARAAPLAFARRTGSPVAV
jgi:D-alanine-D-alanine ligase